MAEFRKEQDEVVLSTLPEDVGDKEKKSLSAKVTPSKLNLKKKKLLNQQKSILLGSIKKKSKDN